MGQHGHGVDAFGTGRLEPAVGTGGKRGTTGPRLNEASPHGVRSSAWKTCPSTDFGDCANRAEALATHKIQRTAPAPEMPYGFTRPLNRTTGHAPRQGGCGFMMNDGGETEISRSPITGGPRQPIPVPSSGSPHPSRTLPRVARRAHSDASEGKSGASTAKAGTPSTHTGTGPSPVTPGSSASMGSGAAGRVVVGMVMGAPFMVRIPHHMMERHVFQLQRMNCSPKKQTPSGKMT